MIARSRWANALTFIWLLGVGAFLLAPLLIVVINSVGVERYVVFPPAGFSLQWYRSIPSFYWPATVYSLQLALASVATAAALTVPAAIGLVRGRIPGKVLIDAFLRSPLQIPLLVSGVAFLLFFSWTWEFTRVDIAGSFVGLWIAHTIVVSPYMLVAVVAQLMKYDNVLDEAAFGMGASPWTTFWRVTFPIIRPSIAAGAFFAFLMSFDNVPVTIFLIEAGESTLPLALFFSTEQDLSRAHYAVGSIVAIVSTAFILLLQRYLGLFDSAAIRS